jgi:hypothetical protein
MLKLLTAPATEPITRTEAKLYLRVDSTADDSLIDILIAAARQMVEEHIGRSLITQHWTLWLDRFPGGNEPWWDGVREASLSVLSNARCEIKIPRGPVSAVTHLKTYNDSGDASTMDSSDYHTDLSGYPARLVLKNGAVWPTDLRSANAIEIQFVAGYGAAGDVPSAIKAAIYQIVAAMYDCRGQDVKMPLLAKKLLGPYVVPSIGELNPGSINS